MLLNPKILAILKWIFLLLIYPFIFVFVLFNLVNYIFYFNGYFYGVNYYQAVPYDSFGHCFTSGSKKISYNLQKNLGDKFCEIDKEFFELWMEEKEKQNDAYPKP
jgi:hypothetical protein